MGATGIQAGGKVEFPLGRRRVHGAGMELWEEDAAALSDVRAGPAAGQGPSGAKEHGLSFAACAPHYRLYGLYPTTMWPIPLGFWANLPLPTDVEPQVTGDVLPGALVSPGSCPCFPAAAEQPANSLLSGAQR